MEKTYSTREVGLALNVCEESVRRWCRDGKLKYDISSRKEGYIITEDDLYVFAEDNPKYRDNIHRLVEKPPIVSIWEIDHEIQQLETNIDSLKLRLKFLKSIRKKLEES